MGTDELLEPPTVLLQLTEAAQTFSLPLSPHGKALLQAASTASYPVLSLLRGFSAPVIASVAEQSAADLGFLMANDSDAFVRWDSSQQCASGPCA